MQHVISSSHAERWDVQQQHPFLWGCADVESQSLQQKLVTTFTMLKVSDWGFLVCQASSHKESLAMQNLLRTSPFWSFPLKIMVHNIKCNDRINLVYTIKLTCLCSHNDSKRASRSRLTEKVDSKVMASVLFIDFTVVRQSVTLKQTTQLVLYCSNTEQHLY